MVKQSNNLTAEEMGPTGSAKTLLNNSNQHCVKTQKSKYFNFMLIKKKGLPYCSLLSKHTLQYYSWIATVHSNILPLSSELKFSVIFSYQNALHCSFPSKHYLVPVTPSYKIKIQSKTGVYKFSKNIGTTSKL
jgi:hypothetical protein